MTVAGIVVAAGKGVRFGAAKATIMLGGKPMWEWSAAALSAAGIGQVIVVGDVPGGIPGGLRRRDSVWAGLTAVAGGIEHVVIHDAARPLASPDLARRVVERIRAGDVDGVVPALPLRDTVKRVDGTLVVETVDREALVAVQTPQAFVVEALRTAHRHDDADAADDAQLVERAGGVVVVVDGEESNLKITYPRDLDIAEGLLP